MSIHTFCNQTRTRNWCCKFATVLLNPKFVSIIFLRYMVFSLLVFSPPLRAAPVTVKGLKRIFIKRHNDAHVSAQLGIHCLLGPKSEGCFLLGVSSRLGSCLCCPQRWQDSGCRVGTQNETWIKEASISRHAKRIVAGILQPSQVVSSLCTWCEVFLKSHLNLNVWKSHVRACITDGGKRKEKLWIPNCWSLRHRLPQGRTTQWIEERLLSQVSPLCLHPFPGPSKGSWCPSPLHLNSGTHWLSRAEVVSLF